MGVTNIDFPDESPCFECGQDVALTDTHCSECGKEMPYRFTLPQLLTSFAVGLIMDARLGGFVIGRHEPEDDIPLYTAPVPGILQLSAFMHGGEFIVNSAASLANKDRLWEINGHIDSVYEPLTSIPISQTTRVFNTNVPKGSNGNDIALLIQSGQFIINRGATRKHFEELVTINDSVAPSIFPTED